MLHVIVYSSGGGYQSGCSAQFFSLYGQSISYGQNIFYRDGNVKHLLFFNLWYVLHVNSRNTTFQNF